jgi:porin
MRNLAWVVIALWGWLPVQACEPVDGESKAISFSASYVGEGVSNLEGGIRRGTGYLGMGNVRVGLDLQGAGLWKGGTLYVNAAATHGATPSLTFVGDFQVVSNIEAGNHLYVQELWYSQDFGALKVAVGLQDFNGEFVANELCTAYLNSSFGVPSTIAANVPLPMFPLTSPGITAVWKSDDALSVLVALFDGRPTDFPDNPHNLSCHFGSEDGAIVAAEVQYSSLFLAGLPGRYKVGAYDHNHTPEPGVEPVYKNCYGFYATMDQTLWRGDAERKLAAFARISISPQHQNINTAFLGGGVNMYGVFSGGRHDMCGIACAYAGLRDVADEATVELTYRTALSPFFFVQPDVQYVIHPFGSGVVLPNSLVVTLRFGVTY